jgi:5-methylthioadenosine/S-adenosylhomocysteine deaminase
MDALVPLDEAISVAGEKRRLFLKQATSDPDVGQVPLDTATETLAEAFRDIVKLVCDLERGTRTGVGRRAGAAVDQPEPLTWSLALDEIQDTGLDLRPRLPFDGPADFTGPRRTALRAAVSEPLSKVLEPVALDPLTVAEDETFLKEIGRQPNLPKAVREGLSRLY